MSKKLMKGALLLMLMNGYWAVASGAEEAAAGEKVSRGATRNVADFQNIPGSMTGGIQEAIDSLPATGGMVIIPPGMYLLRCYVRLRDNISLIGAGASTILKKDDDFQIPLVEDAKKGQGYVVIEDTSKLAVCSVSG